MSDTLRSSLLVPLVQAALLSAARPERLSGSLMAITAEWSELASALLTRLSGPEIRQAKKEAVRAVRLLQGSGARARTKADRALLEAIGQSLKRELTEEEEAAALHGLRVAFAVYHHSLDHDVPPWGETAGVSHTNEPSG